MKQAVAVVSFGTTVPQALAAIEAIEQAVAASTRAPVLRAFTSRIVRRRLFQRDGTDIPAPDALFARLTQQGYDDILCLPTHVIPGFEYEQLCADAARFAAVRMGKPLLWYEADYDACVHAILRSIPPLAQRDALVLAGHGTAHFANAAYCQLEHKFHTAGHTNVFVGTIEGYPALPQLLPRLKAAGIRRVLLMPFLIAAGDHARNDLAGDAPDSWKSRLEAHGLTVQPILRGLGEIPEIARYFAQRSMP